MKWKRIYICSPLRADDRPGVFRNVNKAQQYIELAAERYKCKAVAPHAYLPFILDDNDPDERALALDFGIKLLDLCDVLFVCGDMITEGMRGEILHAAKMGIQIRPLNQSPTVRVAIKRILEAKSA
jgi:hypothetical protein